MSLHRKVYPSIEPKNGSGLISLRTICLPKKQVISFRSLRCQSTNLLVANTVGLVILFRWDPGKASLIGGKCRKFVCMICLVNLIQKIENIPLDYPRRGPNQERCNCRASFRNNILRKFSHTGNFIELKSRKCKEFRKFPRIKTFVLPNHSLKFFNQGIYRYFSTHKTLLDDQTMLILPCN